jgi:hypothetical protein
MLKVKKAIQKKQVNVAESMRLVSDGVDTDHTPIKKPL